MVCGYGGEVSSNDVMKFSMILENERVSGWISIQSGLGVRKGGRLPGFVRSLRAIPEAEVLAMALGYYTPTEILCIKDCIG